MAITRVFIDSRVNDQDSLISQFAPGTEFTVLDASRDGIEQMVSALAGQGGYDSIQIISHGAIGSLTIGSTVLDSSTLGSYTAQLAQIGRALTETGDLLLYGCNIAAGEQGRQFIDMLSHITGADVAASDDATGGTAAGGDWVLEVSTGAVDQAAVLHADGYGSLLVTTSIPIDDAHWNVIYKGTQQYSANGLTFYGSGYRVNNNAVSEDEYNFANSELLVKWQANGASDYMGTGPGITNSKLDFGYGGNLTTQWSFGGSTTIPQNTWLYTRIVFPGDTTGVVSVTTSTGNYSNAGGSILRQDSLSASHGLTGTIWAGLGDNYGSTSSSLLLAEVTTTATVIPRAASVVYDFNDALLPTGLVLPASAIVSGQALLVNPNNTAGQTVTINVSGYSAISFIGSTDNNPNNANDNGGYDRALIKFDGVQKLDFDTTGATQWNRMSIPIPEGTQTIQIVTPTYGGRVWLDDITLYHAVVDDTTSPVFASATVNGSTLVLSYTELNTLDATNTPAVTAFAVSGTSSGAHPVSAVAVDAALKTVTLTLDTAVANGESVTLAYNDPTTGNDANAIQDAAGNDAVTFTAQSLTNNTLDTTAPTLTTSTPLDNATAVAVSDNIVLTFSEAVKAGTGNIIISNGNGDTRTIDIANANDIVGKVTINGSTVTINPATDLNLGSSYNVQMASGVIKDLAENPYAGISDATTLDFRTAGIPITTVTTISLSNDTGASSTDFITNTAAQTISGSLSAATVVGEVVKISLNNGATWVTAANTTGQSSFSLSGVTLTASDTLKVRVEDANGNAAPTASRTYVLDTVAPTVTSVTDSTTASVTKDPVTFTVTFSEALAGVVGASSFTATNGTINGVTRVSGSVYNVTVSPSAGVASGTVVLNLGGTVELKDIAGNVVSAVAGIGEQGIDTLAPATTVTTVSLSSDTGSSTLDFITRTASQTIEGTLSAPTVAGEVVRVSLNNGTTWATASNTAGSNSFSLSGITLVGANNLKVRVEDAVGNAGTTLSQSYRLDTVAPSVSSVTDATPESVTKDPITFTVTFNEAIVGTVGSNNFTATNGVVSTVVKVSDTIYTVLVTPNSGVTRGNSVALSLVGTGLTDTAGNAVLNADLSNKDSQGIDTLGSNDAHLTETDAVLTASGTVISASPFAPQSNAVGSGGYGKFTITADGAWSYATDTPHNEFVAGRNYTDTLTVNAGGTPQLITVTIAGTNDAALITGASTASLTETDTVLSATGTLAVTDPDSSALFVAQSDVAGRYGKFSITADGVWSYTTDTAHNEFALGTNYTDSLTVATADGTTKLIMVTIAGSNDAAVITGTSTASLTETNAVLMASGTLTVEDVDNASAFVARSGVAGSNGFGHFSMTTSGVWTYTTDTAHNEFISGTSYTDSFTVTAKDGTPQVVTVTITGSNDAVVITGTEPAVTAFSTQTPVKVSSIIGINDPDGDAGWNGGSLQVKISNNASVDDSLSLSTVNPGGSGIWVDGTTLKAGSLSIGTVSAASVSSSTPLTITFNANATNALVQEVARALSFNNSSATPGALDRTISFIATDALNLSTTAVQTITVNAPTLTTFDVALSSVNEDTQAEITLSSLLTHGNEVAVGGATIDAFVIKAVSSGSLKIGTDAAAATDWIAGSNATVDATHHAYWTPAANANGSLLNAFTVVAKDSSGRESATAVQACVAVTAVNDLPTTTNDSVTTNEDTIRVLSLTDFGVYADSEGSPMASVKITTLESADSLKYNNGSMWSDVLLDQVITATDISAGKLRFEPALNANGNGYATISFKVSDGTEYSTGAYTLTFNVTSENDAPTFTTLGAPVDSVNEDTTVQITLAELKAQGDEVDVDGTVDAFVIREVSSGSLRIGSSATTATAYNSSSNKTVDATHHAYWMPAVNANGTLNAFTVVARDNNGAESATPIQAVVTVAPVNDLPVISSPSPLTAFTTLNPVNVSSGMLVNDPDGDASWLSGHLKVQITSHASVDDILKLPIASSDGIWLDTNGYKLMAGATWIGTASAVSVSSGALWDFTFNSNATNALVQSVAQAIIFTNSSNVPGTSDRLVTFTVTDNAGESSSVRQMVTVNAPTLTAFAGAVDRVDEDTQVEITHADLAAKGDEADVDGTVDAFVVKGVSSGSLLIGSAVDVATPWVAGSNDTVDLTHHAWWSGAKDANGILNAFTVVARDNYGSESNTAVQVTVDVTPVNDAPTTTDATVTTQEDVSKVLTRADFGAYADVEGTPMAKVQISSLPSYGWLRFHDGTDWRDVSLNEQISAADIDAGRLRFDPAPNANGESYRNATNNAYATFDFRVSDGVGLQRQRLYTDDQCYASQRSANAHHLCFGCSKHRQGYAG